MREEKLKLTIIFTADLDASHTFRGIQAIVLVPLSRHNFSFLSKQEVDGH
jgi:hypothetical protein